MNSPSDTDPALRAHPTPDALWEALERALEQMEDPRHLHGILSAYRAALAAESAPLDALVKAEAERIVGNGRTWAREYAFDALSAALAAAEAAPLDVERREYEAAVREWGAARGEHERNMATLRWDAAKTALDDAILAALRSPDTETACRCVTKDGIRQPTFGCAVHTPFPDTETVGEAG